MRDQFGNVTLEEVYAYTGSGYARVTWPVMDYIATGTLDDINGRFEVLGWAKSFFSRGTMYTEWKWKINQQKIKEENRRMIDESYKYSAAYLFHVHCLVI